MAMSAKYEAPSAPFFLNTYSALACSSYSCMPGLVAFIAATMASPVMRVASRMTAISRATLHGAHGVDDRVEVLDPSTPARLSSAWR